MKSNRWRWHLDEMFVKIRGETHYLWRAVDHESEILESFVTKTRDKKAALKFRRLGMRAHGQPAAIVTGRIRTFWGRAEGIWRRCATGNRALEKQSRR